jgi:hypothetical protein
VTDVTAHSSCFGQNEFMATRDDLLPQLEEFRKDFEARYGRSLTTEELAILEHANELLRAKETPSPK